MARPRGIKQRHPLGSVASRTGVSPLTVVAESTITTTSGVKISELPVADAANATDQLEVNQDGTSKRLTLEQVGTLALSDGTVSVDGDGHIHFVEAGGSNTVPSPYGAPMWFDMSNLSNNIKHGVTFDLRTTNTGIGGNINAIAVQIYSPPGLLDSSGVYISQTGGGNALSVFNLGANRPSGFTNYPLDGFAIEAQTDFGKHSILSSAVDGASLKAVLRGGGPGVQISPESASGSIVGVAIHVGDWDFSNNKFVVGLNGDLYSAGKGQFDTYLGIGINPGTTPLYINSPLANPDVVQMMTATSLANGNSMSIRMGKSAGGVNENINLVYTQDASVSTFKIVHFGDPNGITLQKGGNVVLAGSLTLSGVVKQTVYTVATLPSAGFGPGLSAFVSDATVTTFASIVAGGGANNVPVYSDGTNWRIG